MQATPCTWRKTCNEDGEPYTKGDAHMTLSTLADSNSHSPLFCRTRKLVVILVTGAPNGQCRDTDWLFTKEPGNVAISNMDYLCGRRGLFVIGNVDYLADERAETFGRFVRIVAEIYIALLTTEHEFSSEETLPLQLKVLHFCRIQHTMIPDSCSHDAIWTTDITGSETRANPTTAIRSDPINSNTRCTHKVLKSQQKIAVSPSLQGKHKKIRLRRNPFKIRFELEIFKNWRCKVSFVKIETHHKI